MSDLNIIRMDTINTRVSSVRSVKPTRFLSLRQVLDRTSISRSLVYQLIKDEARPFPAPVHIGRRSVSIEGEVEAFMEAVVAEERKSQCVTKTVKGA